MEDIFAEMNLCKICEGPKYGKSPFVFQPKSQKVMLISACPTIEAIFRPLTSIRFFRQICVALFGERVCDAWLTSFNEDIYWTHLNKCHNEKVFREHNFELLSETCAERWLERELYLLKPELIIILGSFTAGRILKREMERIDKIELSQSCLTFYKWNAEILVTEFPETGAEFRFDVIRDKLEKRFSFMERSNSGKWISGEIKHEVAGFRGMLAGLEFEKEMDEKYNNSLTSEKNTIDYLWWKEIIQGIVKRNQYTLQIQNFIEDQIRTMLLSVVANKANWKIFSTLYDIENIGSDYSKIYERLEGKWQKMFKEYIVYFTIQKGHILKTSAGQTIKLKEIKDIVNKLYALCKIRNYIAHNNGFISPKDVRGISNDFNGIRAYINLVHITDEGLESVRRFKQDIIAILEQIYRAQQENTLC